MDKILFATDGSDSAKKASNYLKSLLDAFDTCQLIVMNVVQPIPVVEGYGFPGEPLPTLMDNAPYDASEITQAVAHDFADYQDRMTFVSVSGHPAVSICTQGEQQHVDLIVVGSHGRSAVDRLLLGSVSNGVVHRSKVPVLVVK